MTCRRLCSPWRTGRPLGAPSPSSADRPGSADDLSRSVVDPETSDEVDGIAVGVVDGRGPHAIRRILDGSARQPLLLNVMEMALQVIHRKVEKRSAGTV